MSEDASDEGALPDRVTRAFRDQGSFERVDETTFASTATPFEGRVAVEPAAEGRMRYRITVRVPMLDEAAEDDVAPVVEEGWYETFELRVADIRGVTERERDLAPTVGVDESGTREAVVEVTFEEIDPRRGANDAAAVVNYVEGTFVQGIIPGYEYGDSVSGIVESARQTGGSDGGGTDGAESDGAGSDRAGSNGARSDGANRE